MRRPILQRIAVAATRYTECTGHAPNAVILSAEIAMELSREVNQMAQEAIFPEHNPGIRGTIHGLRIITTMEFKDGVAVTFLGGRMIDDIRGIRENRRVLITPSSTIGN